MAYDYLVDHAVRNVWCTPDQDTQAIVQPKRLTPPLGVFNQVDVLWRTYKLPVAQTRFHVYQIGQLHPLLMGLFPVSLTWESMADTCKLMNMIVDIYNVNGVQLLRSQVWYMVTYDKNLVIAVQDQPKISIDLANEDIFLRVYSNEFFHSTRQNAAIDAIVVQGGAVNSTQDILNLQAQYLAYRAKPGLVNAYVNGFLVDQIDLITAQPGDVAEFVYDSSVLKVVEWNLSDLKTFSSTLDSKFKYLLHYAGSDEHTIDYQDDNDYFLIQPAAAAGRYAGVLYHKNSADAVRMVTHRDYAIVPAYVVSLQTAQGNDWVTSTTAKIRMVVRKSGYLRALVNEDSRIKELYKLSDADTTAALLGIDATVDNWAAANLEAAAYTHVMRAGINEITRDLVEQAYGYNAISCLLGDTPELTRSSSGQMVIDVPYGLQTRATGYEYDANGYLLGWYTHVQGSVYAARNLSAALVEMIAGDVANELDEAYGLPVQPLDVKANYRMYRCPMAGGVPTNVWEDVTDTTGQYTISVDGSTLTWTLDPTLWYTCVRSDRTNLGYTLNLEAADGLLQFSLVTEQLRFNTLGNYVMQIPMGELDLWLNGKSLIEGLDYVVQFPRIVVTNKEYLVDPANSLQRIDLRCSGFCKPDFSREIPQDRGFVVWGQLSHNNRFDLRDDKVMRVVVGGAVYDRSELTFAEDNPAVLVEDARNGAPYMLRDIVVPMRGATNQNTYAMRAHSQAIDKKISDYLTLKNPEVEPLAPSAIQQYTIYSPFVNKIMMDLVNEVLADPILKQHYNDNDVVRLCQPYEWLLAYDPTQDANASDARFVVIHPHNQPGVVNIDIYYYKFLSRVVAIYCQGRTELSHTVSLTTIA